MPFSTNASLNDQLSSLPSPHPLPPKKNKNVEAL